MPGEARAAATPGAPAAGYRVLARKYRPSNFDDLIGHGPMVQTLSNAFATGRIAQAWMLTGVRGVGKTTTARILARALNYEVEGGASGPSVAMPELGIHCRAIMEGRHVDVIEIDAASHTGVSDIREITDAARYKPVSARYKVYIVDEVHMLSTAAFNALLKTLEEPPEHVKFVFATTEIRKVPITVLSRCQRFDLRRVDAGLMVKHLSGIAAAENVVVDDEALALIARAAEGSVRDSLTILDQAIAHGGGRVDGAEVRAMLGLADRGRVIDLFEMVMKGDIAGALGELADQYDTGADPAVVLSDLAAFTHLVTRTKLVPASADDPSLTETERERGRSFAGTLPVRVLARAWQMLLKGIAEVQTAPRPLPAAEMVLVRIAYAADLPTPDEALKALADMRGGAAPGRGPAAPGGSSGGGASAASTGATTARAPQLRSLPTPAGAPAGATARLAPDPAAAPRPAEAPVLAAFDDVIALAAARRDIGLKVALERHVRLVRYEDGRIEINPGPGAGPNLAGELGRKLTEWTGRRWIVAVSREDGAATVQERRETQKRSLEDEARADPLVSAILASFPGAKIVDVRSVLDEPLPGLGAPGDGPLPPDYGADGFDPDAYDLDAMFRDLDDD
ncbi:DNA polymerase III subunit gamma/tau [Methylobrevis albus]|uniref:DNA polymerase III subunit gamma/tau n=1 Tax=Methylobrevis albus TaxID=2793297 RepID=A0A931I4L6_9HYPH|nr:DNA polymerase III subunit gamma/tau [Methylobrevis albus]MBH0238776.1 DNA polymerase III subunit gamma/tau [Methylobrevis albus]